jgi:hypothetical protein
MAINISQGETVHKFLPLYVLWPSGYTILLLYLWAILSGYASGIEYYLWDQIVGDELGDTRSTYTGQQKYIHGSGEEN